MFGCRLYKTCILLLITLTSLVQVSCRNSSLKNESTSEQKKTDKDQVLLKPTSSFQDTLVINEKSAVFYAPDSLQLEKIKQITDSVVYRALEHEFSYQVHNAKLVLRKTWPQLAIIESMNYRYLLFKKEDGSAEVIDLNTKSDTYGLFVFDGIHQPVLIDMTNIETDISFYLDQSGK